MLKKINDINKLIEDFNKFPGVGKKTAERYVFFLVAKKNPSFILNLANNLQNLVKNIKKCIICGHITEEKICFFCADKKRNVSEIMVVADSRDVFYFEKNKIHKGLYHVLGGLIDLAHFIKPENLNFNSLMERISHKNSYIKEIIIATNSTFEGEITANYLKNLIKQNYKKNIKITRLACGIPMGLDLNYIDDKTLLKAFENRNDF